MKEQKDRYEIFLKVCETGSFSKAAEALNYTQSGISQMMAGLEEELGVSIPLDEAIELKGMRELLEKAGCE